MNWLIALLILVLLSACSFKDTNTMIAQSNTDRFIAFTQGMNNAGTEGARVAIAMAFAGGMGMQSFYRPETAKDYANAFLPYVSLLTPLLWSLQGDDSRAITAGRDVYMNSSRADTRNPYQSVVQDYLLNGQASTVAGQVDFPVDNSLEMVEPAPTPDPELL